MVDLGWSEITVIAGIAVIILGPKELPNALRMVTRAVRKLRALSGEMRRHVDDIVREAELQELLDQTRAIARADINSAIETAEDGAPRKETSPPPAGQAASSAPASSPPVASSPGAAEKS